MEDRVIGPLTLTQFFYLLFGGLFLYLLNSWTANSPLRVLYYVIFPLVASLSIALAFVKIQERPFIFFLGSLVRYMQRPRRRVWQKGQRQKLTQIVEKQDVVDDWVARVPRASAVAVDASTRQVGPPEHKRLKLRCQPVLNGQPIDHGVAGNAA